MMSLGPLFMQVINLDFVAKGTRLNYGGLIIIFFLVLTVEFILKFFLGFETYGRK